MSGPRTLCDLFDRTVAARGPQLALRDDGAFVLTWSEYAAQANAAAAGLAGLGVGHGDTVACWLVDRPELDLAHAGALRLGAVPFSLHPTFTLAQAAHAIAAAAARVLITEPAFLRAALVVRGGRTPLRIIVLVEGADACALTWAELLDCAPAGLDPDVAARAVQPDDTATLIRGADGSAVVITHRQIVGLIARGDACDPMIRSQSLLGPYGRWQVPDQV
jgi:long-chain acyl-CoA synthetase